MHDLQSCILYNNSSSLTQGLGLQDQNFIKTGTKRMRSANTKCLLSNFNNYYITAYFRRDTINLSLYIYSQLASNSSPASIPSYRSSL
jgi:hypothetical protein